MKNIYTEEYYKTGNYINYLEKYRKYLSLAKELREFLNKMGILNYDTKILDYGCAVGFLLRAFKHLGYKNVIGYDISDWALSRAKDYDVEIIYNYENRIFDIIFCLDVLEHMSDKDVNFVLQNLKTQYIIVRIPVAQNEGEDYWLEVSRKDKTHINCKTKQEWKNVFLRNGFDHFFELNLSTIYTSPGVFSFLCIKGKNEKK